MALKATNGSTRQAVAIVFLPLVATIGGCSSIRVETHYDPTVDFTTYTNFGWLPVPKARTGDLRIDHAALDAVERAAVNKELAARGFKTTADPPFSKTGGIGRDTILIVVVHGSVLRSFHGWSVLVFHYRRDLGG